MTAFSLTQWHQTDRLLVLTTRLGPDRLLAEHMVLRESLFGVAPDCQPQLSLQAHAAWGALDTQGPNYRYCCAVKLRWIDMFGEEVCRKPGVLSRVSRETNSAPFCLRRRVFIVAIYDPRFSATMRRLGRR